MGSDLSTISPEDIFSKYSTRYFSHRFLPISTKLYGEYLYPNSTLVMEEYRLLLFGDLLNFMAILILLTQEHMGLKCQNAIPSTVFINLGSFGARFKISDIQ